MDSIMFLLPTRSPHHTISGFFVVTFLKQPDLGEQQQQQQQMHSPD
jgi:hypothetical protein